LDALGLAAVHRQLDGTQDSPLAWIPLPAGLAPRNRNCATGSRSREASGQAWLTRRAAKLVKI